MVPAQFLVTSHTQHILPGGTFVAVKGMRADGVQYIFSALQAGAKKIVIERGVTLDELTLAAITQHHAQLERVDNARLALAQLSAAAYHYPARQLTIIGITGTKGKSTTTFLLAHLLRTAGHKTAFLSTVHNRILDTIYPTQLTTQQPDYIHAFLRACVDAGVTHVVMEVAAQAVSLYRVATIDFAAILFLNFSQEHGEFYATQEDYFAAKLKLLEQLKPGGTLIFNEHNTQVAAIAATHATAVAFSTREHSGPALMGDFNKANAAAAATAAQYFGVSEAQIEAGLHSFTGVPGRLQKFTLPNGAIVFIDYAHNPDSIARVLQAVRSLTDQLIVITGAGGDRDVAKRPLMGQAAAQYADLLFLTTDNPRSEDPAAIILQMLAGIDPAQRKNVIIELDREKAIREAYARSSAGSMIMLLGKGPDEYQEVKGVKTRFSEREILESL